MKRLSGGPSPVTAYLTIFYLPWIIEPVYGFVSDFLPLFGYRRKVYLVIANAAGPAPTPGLPDYCTDQLVFALLLTAYALAI